MITCTFGGPQNRWFWWPCCILILKGCSGMMSWKNQCNCTFNFVLNSLGHRCSCSGPSLRSICQSTIWQFRVAPRFADRGKNCVSARSRNANPRTVATAPMSSVRGPCVCPLLVRTTQALVGATGRGTSILGLFNPDILMRATGVDEGAGAIQWGGFESATLDSSHPLPFVV